MPVSRARTVASEVPLLTLGKVKTVPKSGVPVSASTGTGLPLASGSKRSCSPPKLFQEFLLKKGLHMVFDVDRVGLFAAGLKPVGAMCEQSKTLFVRRPQGQSSPTIFNPSGWGFALSKNGEAQQRKSVMLRYLSESDVLKRTVAEWPLAPENGLWVSSRNRQGVDRLAEYDSRWFESNPPVSAHQISLPCAIPARTEILEKGKTREAKASAEERGCVIEWATGSAYDPFNVLMRPTDRRAIKHLVPSNGRGVSTHSLPRSKQPVQRQICNTE